MYGPQVGFEQQVAAKSSKVFIGFGSGAPSQVAGRTRGSARCALLKMSRASTMSLAFQATRAPTMRSSSSCGAPSSRPCPGSGAHRRACPGTPICVPCSSSTSRRAAPCARAGCSRSAFLKLVSEAFRSPWYAVMMPSQVCGRGEVGIDSHRLEDLGLRLGQVADVRGLFVGVERLARELVVDVGELERVSKSSGVGVAALLELLRRALEVSRSISLSTAYVRRAPAGGDETAGREQDRPELETCEAPLRQAPAKNAWSTRIIGATSAAAGHLAARVHREHRVADVDGAECPTRAAVIGPIVEPQARSLRTTKCCGATPTPRAQRGELAAVDGVARVGLVGVRP